MGLLFEAADEGACPRQRQVEVVDTEEQQEAVARLRVSGARQRGMLVCTPRVEAEEDRSIGVEDLPEVVVFGRRLRQAEQRLVPLEAAGHVAHPDDRPGALHGSSGAHPQFRAGPTRPLSRSAGRRLALRQSGCRWQLLRENDVDLAGAGTKLANLSVLGGVPELPRGVEGGPLRHEEEEVAP